jgi:nitrate/TMAO reductase-like tetraheme cytochrome c subunit
MKKNKLIIVMISVIAIGLFALPSTFSYSGSMHTFKQIDPTSADTINAFCMKCHTGAIAEQLAASDNGLYQGGGPIHKSVQCQGCHQITRTDGQPNGYNVEASSTEHAARLPSCLDCHLQTGTLMQIGNAGVEIRATTEAHKDFKSDTDNDIECIGCHTEATKTGSVSTGMTSQPTTIAGLTIG